MMKIPSTSAIVGIFAMASIFILLLGSPSHGQVGNLTQLSPLSNPTPTPINNSCRWIDEPHQGMSVIPNNSYVWAVTARISYANPAFNCRDDLNSWTTEWVMIVGPDSSTDWVQFGWTRNYADSTVHAWSQWSDKHGLHNMDYNYYPTDVASYMIAQYYEPPMPGPAWYLSIDRQYVDNIYTTGIDWWDQLFGDHGVQAQFYGEVTKLENNMGDWYPGVAMDSVYWLDDNDLWNPPLNGVCINSPVPRYGGQCSGRKLMNWTGAHQVALPLLMNNP
jgi:hypothetical protein